MAESLQKQSKGLSTAGAISPTHSAIARLLEQAAQVYQTEVLPGQMRVWMECFKDEKPSVLMAAFNEHFMGSVFFPKPADIFGIIAQKRMAARLKEYEPIDKEAVRREQETPEWQEASRKVRERLRELAGMKGMPASTSGRDRLKEQTAQLQNSRPKSGATKISDTEPSR